MRQAARDKACTRLNWVILTAGSFLAVWCVIFGSAVAAFVPSSVEERLENLVVFGLVPAFIFYVSGHILRHLLGFSCKLCELFAKGLLRLLAPFAISFANEARATVSEALDGCRKTLARCQIATRRWTQRLSHLSEIAFTSIDRQCRHFCKLTFELLCLLIRTTARFIIKAQHLMIGAALMAERRILAHANFEAGDSFAFARWTESGRCERIADDAVGERIRQTADYGSVKI